MSILPILYANVFVILFGALCQRKVLSDMRLGKKRSVFAAAMVWVIYIAHTATTAWASWNSVWPIEVGRYLALGIGSGLLLAGCGVLLSGMYEFRSLARMSGRRPFSLVRTGIYRWTRNPQNVGWGLALVGIALMGMSGAALLLALQFWVAFRIYIPSEEHYLERIFRDEWRRYCRSTPRFLGLPGPLPDYRPLDLKAERRDGHPSAARSMRLDPLAADGGDDS